MLLSVKLYRRFAHRLVLYQLISALVFLLVCVSELIFISYNEDVKVYQPLCALIGCLLTVTVDTKFLITFWLTFHLFVFAVCQKDLRRLEPLYIVGIPLLFCWIPFLNHLYGISGAWCWIMNWKGDCSNDKILFGTIEQYSFLYVPGMILFVINFFLVFLTITVLLYRAYCLKNTETEPLLRMRREQQRKAFKEILPLMAYPIIFMVVFLPSVINRVYGAVSSRIGFSLFVLHAVTGPSWGLFVGVTVVVHICLIKCCNVQLIDRSKFLSSQNRHKEVETDPIFTVDTLASTNARTEFIFSQESEGWETVDVTASK